jgi:hypothetical protein
MKGSEYLRGLSPNFANEEDDDMGWNIFLEGPTYLVNIMVGFQNKIATYST